MNRKVLFGFICMLMLIGSFAHGQVTRKMAKITLNNLAGEPRSLADVSGNTVTVFYYIAPDCPLCINYSKNIREFHEQFGSQNVQFFGVLPGKFYSKAEMEAYVREYNVPIEILLDPDYELSKAMKARVTPEVYVYDNRGSLQYQGKIDNWVIKLGRKRTVITEFYLEDALTALLAGNPVETSKTDAIGCIIEYR